MHREEWDTKVEMEGRGRRGVARKVRRRRVDLLCIFKGRSHIVSSNLMIVNIKEEVGVEGRR